MKQFIVTTIFILFCLLSNRVDAQELEVKYCKIKENDLSARTHQVQDNNKIPCALIKVAIVGDDVEFTGNVVGTPTKTGGEYYVYVPAKTKYIQISRSNYLPIKVVFSDYDITLESLTTYELRINSPEIAQNNNTAPILQRQYVIFNISPQDSHFYLNDIPQTLEDGRFEKELEIGNYSYRVEASLCESQSGQFILTSDDAYRETISLKQNFGYLEISAQDNIQATVFIDSEESGTTPMKSVKLSSGTHTIRLEKAGYEIAEKVITVAADGKTTSVKMSLVPTFATVTLKATTSDTKISVDGKETQTGVWSGKLDAGEHSILVEKENYQSKTLVLSFQKGETKSVEIPELTPYYGIVKITSTPSGAKIYVDGTYLNETPFNTNKITAGQHEIMAELNGFNTQTVKVTVKRDTEITVPFDMNRVVTKSSIKAVQKGAGSDLSANGTANCYIAKPNGEYSFNATVKGNSSQSVGSPTSAEVLWESFGSNVKPNVGDVVKNVSYSNGRVTFTAGKEGNAVIAVKSSNGDILWSWHIWVTSADLYANRQTYTGGAVMMDRNLGALSATPGDYKALGLLYQWGRKDPFLPSSSISNRNSKAQATVSEPSLVKSNSTTGTIEYVTKHPTTFVTYNKGNKDWYYTGGNYTDDTRWNSDKGIYDPCPPGWRVPDGGPNGVWKKAGFTNQTYDNTNKGMLFGSNYSKPSAWYPAAGYRWSDDGGLRSVGGYGGYWSCTPISNDAYHLGFNSNGSVNPQYDSNRAHGRSVRCQSE